MIGKIIFLLMGIVIGFVVGLIFGPEIGEWFIKQILNQIGTGT